MNVIPRPPTHMAVDIRSLFAVHTQIMQMTMSVSIYIGNYVLQKYKFTNVKQMLFVQIIHITFVFEEISVEAFIYYFCFSGSMKIAFGIKEKLFHKQNKI